MKIFSHAKALLSYYGSAWRWARGEDPTSSYSIRRDAPAVPPAETRMMLEGLRSDLPRLQCAASETLGRFPLVLRRCRDNGRISVFQLLTNWARLVELQLDFFCVASHDHFF